MYKKSGKFMITVLVIVAISSSISADYVETGKTYMFEGTISGLRHAYESFEQAMQDPSYEITDELLFLHSVARASMVFLRDDGGEVDSFRELAAAFGLEIVDDSVDLDFLEIVYPINHRDRYEIPSDAPDEQEISDILQNIIAVELGQIIDNLDLIKDEPDNRFVIFFEPAQTGMERRLMVGYAEVLMLKGFLTAFKAGITADPAYDMEISNIDELIEKIYASYDLQSGAFSIQKDVLDANPNLLKLLLTENDDSSGRDVLAQAAADLIESINYTIEAIEYLKFQSGLYPEIDAERLVYIEEADFETADSIIDNLALIRDSLVYDTTANITIESTDTYAIESDEFEQASLNIIYNIIGEPERGTFEVFSDFLPVLWQISNAYSDKENPLELQLELENFQDGNWSGGYMLIVFNSDKSEILSGYFDYWGYYGSGIIDDIYGIKTGFEEFDFELDLNPIYGSTPRYPQPVSPRDLLPEFNKYNGFVPNTMGKGLDYDPTLGGILPWMTQKDWTILLELQPQSVVMIQELNPIQFGSYYDYYSGISDWEVGFWLNSQIVFDDISGDVETDQSGNLDIDRLYLGYHLNRLFGEITFYDASAWLDRRLYELTFRNSLNCDVGAIRLRIDVYNSEYAFADIYQYRNDFGYGYWQHLDIMAEAYTTAQGIQFWINALQLPFLPGRFVELNSFADNDWRWKTGDMNYTYLQIGPLGTASGTVEFDGCQEQTIFIQAYTDRNNPEKSVISSAAVKGSGEFTLEGIGLGWQGYIRAFTPMFGFENLFELGCIELEDRISFKQWTENIYGLSLNVNTPYVLGIGEPKSAVVEWDKYSRHIFAFDAIEGYEYTMFFEGSYIDDLVFSLYGRDGSEKLIKIEYFYDYINWTCPKSGRYFIEIAKSFDYLMDDVFYTLTIESNQRHYASDIASAEGIGIKDGKVDYYDLYAITAYWLEDFQIADINKDGIINLEDFSILASEWMSN